MTEEHPLYKVIPLPDQMQVRENGQITIPVESHLVTEQERIVALCTLVDSCLSELYVDSWKMEYDTSEECTAREKLVRDYKQKLTELAPSYLHGGLWSLKPENITF